MLINEPIHLLQNSSSCIELIFTLQANIVVESSVHSSTGPSCRHQIVFIKFDLKIYYSPPYLRDVWHYKEENTVLIKQAVNYYNWEKASSITNINEKFLFSTRRS